MTDSKVNALINGMSEPKEPNTKLLFYSTVAYETEVKGNAEMRLSNFIRSQARMEQLRGWNYRLPIPNILIQRLTTTEKKKSFLTKKEVSVEKYHGSNVYLEFDHPLTDEELKLWRIAILGYFWGKNLL